MATIRSTCWTTAILLAVFLLSAGVDADDDDNSNIAAAFDSAKEELLNEIGDVTTGNLGSLCISKQHRSVPVPIRTDAFENARQKADMMARLALDLAQLDNQSINMKRKKPCPALPL